MSEYIVSVPDKEAELFIARFGIGGTTLFGHQLTDEIVRCRDCYFAYEIEGGYWCDRFVCGREHVTPNGFCAWASRREP